MDTDSYKKWETSVDYGGIAIIRNEPGTKERIQILRSGWTEPRKDRPSPTKLKRGNSLWK